MHRILVEYTLTAGANAEAVEARIRQFVAALGALGAGVSYTSHRRRGEERAYAHLGVFADDEARAKVQDAPLLREFGQYLRTVTAEPPRTTWLDVVATTG